jgi:hypothetical protein
MSVKNASDIIGNRTRYLPACSAVSQQTVLFLIATVAIKNNDILMYVNSAQLNRKY